MFVRRQKIYYCNDKNIFWGNICSFFIFRICRKSINIDHKMLNYVTNLKLMQIDVHFPQIMMATGSAKK